MTTQSMSFDAWQSTVRTVCGPLESRPARNVTFDGRVNLRRVADFYLIEHRATVEALHWDRRHIAEISTPFCYVILQLGSGRLHVEQAGKAADLGAGDWALIDSLRPARFAFAGPMHILALNLPRDLVALRAHGRDIPCATRSSGASGESAVFAQFARSLFAHAGTLRPDELRHRESVLDLLFLALPGCFEARDRSRERQLERVLRFIDEHLTDSELSPQIIASASAVSVRHLHRLFRETDLSASEWILQRRLDRARCDLADARFAGNTVFEVATAWGFKDAAHFSRAFRAAYGLAPREYRRQLLGAQREAGAVPSNSADPRGGFVIDMSARGGRRASGRFRGRT